MKLNKMIFPVALALTVVLAGAGCKKGMSGVTQLPNMNPGMTGVPSGGDTLPGGGQFGSGGGPVSGNVPAGGGSTSTDWNPDDYRQDPTALAAYTLHFAFDSATIKDSEQASLSSVAQALQGNPNAKLLVQGNCDERGTEEYNRALGERRALAAREALAKLGLDPARVRTISFGKDKPVDPAHDDAAFAKNRRDDFVLCTPK